MLHLSHHQGDLIFITILPADDTGDEAAQIRQAYAELRDYARLRPATLFHERVYGRLSLAETVTRIRRAELEPSLPGAPPPLTYVEGTPANGSGFAGIHAVAVAEKPETAVEEVRTNGRICGRQFRGTEAEYLVLADVARLLPAAAHRDRAGEALQAIDLAEAILTERHWSFNDVRRTWFYLDDILAWYPDFNQARNQVYHRIGFLNGSIQSVVPASTGIYGRSAFGLACTLDLLAMRPLGDRPFRMEQMTNPKQNEAPEYGSAFSRGIAVTTRLNTYYFLSGTASIDERGVTVHPGDMRQQTRRTLQNIQSLLENAGGALDQIAQATAFVKYTKDIPIFEEELRHFGLSDLPVITTIADVCREDLLFELDATAIKPLTEDAAT